MIKHTLALALAVTACSSAPPKEEPIPAEADPAMDAADQALADKLVGRWDVHFADNTWSRYDFKGDTYMIYDYEGSGEEGPVATYMHSWVVYRGAMLARFPDNKSPVEACLVLGDWVDADHFSARAGSRAGTGCRPSKAAALSFARSE